MLEDVAGSPGKSEKRTGSETCSQGYPWPLCLFSTKVRPNVQVERSILERAGLASGLLTEDQIDRAWHALTENSHQTDLSLEELTDQELSDQLVALGYLNPWQAEQLSQGRTKFTLGSYRILDAIGHGGMGYVFKGEHVLLGRVEAIKVLPRNQTNPVSIANFCREIRAQASLDHLNLVRLTYADTDGDTYFLVSEFVPGSDLRRLVHQRGPLEILHAALVVSQAAEALQYAHGQGLVHRDVKPGNLLVTTKGVVKLTDLGLAIFSSETVDPTRRTPRHIVGTADYLAPEVVISPAEVRTVSDIYSLGCTLYYAMTGKVPFPGGDTADKLRRHLDERPISPLRFNPSLDKALVDVVEAMMCKRPEERVASAQEVVRLLRPWASQADQEVWKALGKQAQTAGKQSLRGAMLADTKPLEDEPPVPARRRGAKTVRVSLTPPLAAASPPATQSDEVDTSNAPPAGLQRTTVVLILTALGASMAATIWAFFGIE